MLPILRLRVSAAPVIREMDLPFFRQSAQFLLSGCFTSSLRIRAFRSVVALSISSDMRHREPRLTYPDETLLLSRWRQRGWTRWTRQAEPMTRHHIWRAYLYLDATLTLSVIDLGVLFNCVQYWSKHKTTWQKSRIQGAIVVCQMAYALFNPYGTRLTSQLPYLTLSS